MTMCSGETGKTVSGLDEWEASRARFSHDWLRNGLAIALGKVSNVLSGAVDDPGAWAQLAELLQHWPTYKERALGVLASACDVLSPKRFFARGLLSELDAESKEFLGEIVDTAWRRNQQPETVVQRAEECLRQLDTLTFKLIEALKTAPGTLSEPEGDLQALVTEVRGAVTRLSMVMTRLGRCARL